MNENIKISKSFTVKDWKNLRLQLITKNSNWNEAAIVFEDRINSRFLEPIEKIKSIGKNEGEGFSIVLISVVLLEFLASFELGKTYSVNKENLAPHEYSVGVKIIKEFLRESPVFSPYFDSNEKIQKFYEQIRCGLVHEARTLKNSTIIHNESKKNTKKESIFYLDDCEFKLNRDLLLQKIKDHIQAYKLRLSQGEILLRKNYLLKMDDICGASHVWYFIYGSNLNEEQLGERLNAINETYLFKKKCFLKDYEFRYNKKSIDSTAKANIVEKQNGVVMGIAVLMLEERLDHFITTYEVDYEKTYITVHSFSQKDINQLISFRAVTCKSNKFTTNAPSEEYVSRVISGAISNCINEDYISNNLKYF